MFHILGFIFIIILFVLIIGFSLISGVLRLFFGRNRRSFQQSFQQGFQQPQQGYQQDTYSQSNNQSAPSQESGARGNRKKLFDKNEGEYVDFEEIKE